MSDQSDNRFYRQRSSSSEHEIQRELRRQIAQATEAAVREQIAAQIEAQPPEYFSATMISKALAAKIARGRL